MVSRFLLIASPIHWIKAGDLSNVSLFFYSAHTHNDSKIPKWEIEEKKWKWMEKKRRRTNERRKKNP